MYIYYKVLTSAMEQTLTVKNKHILDQNDCWKPAKMFVKKFFNGKGACLGVIVTNVANYNRVI